jgi:hypothetical protein
VTLRSAKAGLVVVRTNRDGRRIGQCRALYVKDKRRAVRRLRVGR